MSRAATAWFDPDWASRINVASCCWAVRGTEQVTSSDNA
jgi:hypothetical protein